MNITLTTKQIRAINALILSGKIADYYYPINKVKEEKIKAFLKKNIKGNILTFPEYDENLQEFSTILGDYFGYNKYPKFITETFTYNQIYALKSVYYLLFENGYEKLS